MCEIFDDNAIEKEKQNILNEIYALKNRLELLNKSQEYSAEKDGNEE
jgi:hypothetical protein